MVYLYIIGFPILFLLVIFNINKTKKRNDLFDYFARSHGLESTISLHPAYSGIFKPKFIIKAYQGKDVKTNDLLQLMYFGGNDYNSSRLAISIPIKDTGLHVFIKSKIINSELPIALKMSQRFEAEGDFGKYFDIYTPKDERLGAMVNSLYNPKFYSSIRLLFILLNISTYIVITLNFGI